jgi:hypothetical protein
MLASGLAFANSGQLPQPDVASELRQPAIILQPSLHALATEQSGAFRSTLREVAPGSAALLMPEWNHSRLAEQSYEQAQDKPLALPEPRTAILVSLGLLAIVFLKTNRLTLLRQTARVN